MWIKSIVLLRASLFVCLGNRTEIESLYILTLTNSRDHDLSYWQFDLPKVIYPIQSLIGAPESCNSNGGSRWLNKTCGAVWLALLPSFNSCKNIFPITMSSSSLKIVLKTTVTLSLFASTYLRNCTDFFGFKVRYLIGKHNTEHLHIFLISVFNDCPFL